MKKDFEPGDIIEFADEKYIVIENNGDTGTVQPVGDPNCTIRWFRWLFEGEECKLVKRYSIE